LFPPSNVICIQSIAFPIATGQSVDCGCVSWGRYSMRALPSAIDPYSWPGTTASFVPKTGLTTGEFGASEPLLTSTMIPSSVAVPMLKATFLSPWQGARFGLPGRVHSDSI
jgi:hypothetical protein